MKNIFIITLIILSAIITNAQRDIDPKEMIGFGCYSNGMPSETVLKFSKLLAKSKYNSLTKFLDSKNNAEKALSVYVCTKLYRIGKLDLSSENLTKINSIKNSVEMVPVCSGCTYFQKVPIRELFKESDDGFFMNNGNYWFENYVMK